MTSGPLSNRRFYRSHCSISASLLYEPRMTNNPSSLVESVPMNRCTSEGDIAGLICLHYTLMRGGSRLSGSRWAMASVPSPP